MVPEGSAACARKARKRIFKTDIMRALSVYSTEENDRVVPWKNVPF